VLELVGVDFFKTVQPEKYKHGLSTTLQIIVVIKSGM
jgi:hypothetical protein